MVDSVLHTLRSPETEEDWREYHAIPEVGAIDMRPVLISKKLSGEGNIYERKTECLDG
jgi:hypothetical protein